LRPNHDGLFDSAPYLGKYKANPPA
jgi:hypothetical protein